MQLLHLIFLVSGIIFLVISLFLFFKMNIRQVVEDTRVLTPLKKTFSESEVFIKDTTPEIKLSGGTSPSIQIKARNVSELTDDETTALIESLKSQLDDEETTLLGDEETSLLGEEETTLLDNDETSILDDEETSLLKEDSTNDEESTSLLNDEETSLLTEEETTLLKEDN